MEARGVSDQRNPIVTKLRTEGDFLPYAKPSKANQVKQSSQGRTCECGTRLSMYNHGSLCGPCQASQAIQA